MYAWKNTEFKRFSEKRDIESSIKSIFLSVRMLMEDKMQHLFLKMRRYKSEFSCQNACNFTVLNQWDPNT
jgi:hypothetical protein